MSIEAGQVIILLIYYPFHVTNLKTRLWAPTMSTNNDIQKQNYLNKFWKIYSAWNTKL